MILPFEKHFIENLLKEAIMSPKFILNGNHYHFLFPGWIYVHFTCSIWNICMKCSDQPLLSGWRRASLDLQGPRHPHRGQLAWDQQVTRDDRKSPSISRGFLSEDTLVIQWTRSHQCCDLCPTRSEELAGYKFPHYAAESLVARAPRLDPDGKPEFYAMRNVWF